MAVTTEGVKDRIKSAANPAIQTRGPHFPCQALSSQATGTQHDAVLTVPDGNSLRMEGPLALCTYLFSVFSSGPQMAGESHGTGYCP